MGRKSGAKAFRCESSQSGPGGEKSGGAQSERVWRCDWRRWSSTEQSERLAPSVDVPLPEYEAPCRQTVRHVSFPALATQRPERRRTGHLLGSFHTAPWSAWRAKFASATHRREAINRKRLNHRATHRNWCSCRTGTEARALTLGPVTDRLRTHRIRVGRPRRRVS